jgi:hypothetical protein
MTSQSFSGYLATVVTESRNVKKKVNVLKISKKMAMAYANFIQ